jgi:ubiquinol-cytochrome c reductase cytochrome c subunit
MGLATSALAPEAQARVVYEQRCAACHGFAGDGAYVATGVRSPAIRRAAVSTIAGRVRHGGAQMPAFSPAALDDSTLQTLATYVHEGLERASEQPPLLGPRALDPLIVGLFAWVGLGILVCAMALVFAEGRNE